MTVNHSITFLGEEKAALTLMVESTQLQYTCTVISRITCLISPTTIRDEFKPEGCDPFSKLVSIAGGTDCDAAEDVELEAESA